MTRTGTLARLFAHDGEPAIELHPQDIARRGWREGDLVRVSSRQGECVLALRACDTLRPAQAFVAMHWGDEYLRGRTRDGRALAGVNALTNSARCPQSRQPELKHTAVRLERAELPWRLVAAGWLPAGEALGTQAALRTVMARFGHASCVPFGREPDGRIGLCLRAASEAAVDEGVMAQIASCFGLDGSDALRYADPSRGRRRALRLAAPDGALDAFLLAGDTAAAEGVLALLRERGAAAGIARAVLSGSAQPLQAHASRSPQVCNCVDVDEATINGALAGYRGDASGGVAWLQQRLRCGTQCGSCLPAVKALVQRHATSTRVAQVLAP